MKAYLKADYQSKKSEYYQRSRKNLKARLEISAGREKPDSCEVCGTKGTICWDHNHETGLFRGWICVNCNVALGLVKDNKEILLKLAKYLEEN